MSINPYGDTDLYSVFSCADRQKWLEARKERIGGSEAGAFMSCGWNTIRDVFLSKNSAVKESAPNSAMQYGIAAEDSLRSLFGFKHLELDVFYRDNTILKSRKYDWAAYSPDGLLYDESSGKFGILEVKTRLSKGRSKDFGDWGSEEYPRVPDLYYWQVLHGLLVTGFDFVYFTCEIRYMNNESRIIERKILREDVLEDIEILKNEEQEAWEKYFLTGEIPPISFSL